MNDPIHPTLYAGAAIPFQNLSADEFEKFIYGVLEVVGPLHDFSPKTLGTDSADGGVDIDCRRLSSPGLVCIQAKRYKKPLQIGDVARELAKLAMRAAAGGRSYTAHYIITSGTLGTKLYTTKIQSNLPNVWLKDTVDKATNDSKLKALREGIKERGLIIADVVRDHLDAIGGSPRIWSADMFDEQIARVMDQCMPLIERHFTVQPVLLDSPRPKFCFETYSKQLTARSSDSHELEKTLSLSNSPTNIHLRDGTAGAVSYPGNFQGMLSDFIVLGSQQGAVNYLVVKGPGGSGKTDLSRRTAATLCKSKSKVGHRYLPIVVDLGSYRSNLKHKIHTALGLRWGHWTSIPAYPILFLDGLDRMTSEMLSSLESELDDLLCSYQSNICIVLTCRLEGPRFSFIVSAPYSTLEIAPLGLGEIFKYLKAECSHKVAVGAMKSFSRATAEAIPLLYHPFGVVHFSQVVKDPSYSSDPTPTHWGVLADELVKKKFKETRIHRHSSLSARARGVPAELALKCAKKFAYNLVWVRKLATADRTLCTEVVRSFCLPIFVSYGFEKFDAADAIDLMVDYEILREDEDGILEFCHDLYGTFLAAEDLAHSWREYEEQINGGVDFVIWSYAAHYLPESETKFFVERVYLESALLAADVANALGGRWPEVITSRLVDSAAEMIGKGRFGQREYVTCLMMLATEGAVAELRRVLTSQEHFLRNAARTALGLVGDVSHLQKLLSEFDGPAAMFMKGGPVSVWRRAPLDVRLGIVRRKLDLGGWKTWPIESTLTLGWFGSGKEDLKRITHLLEQEQTDEIVWEVGLYAIRCLNPDEARQRCRLLLARPTSLRAATAAVKTLDDLREPVEPMEVINLLRRSHIEEDQYSDNLCKYLEKQDLSDEDATAVMEVVKDPWSILLMSKKSGFVTQAREQFMKDFSAGTLKYLIQYDHQNLSAYVDSLVQSSLDTSYLLYICRILQKTGANDARLTSRVLAILDETLDLPEGDSNRLCRLSELAPVLAHLHDTDLDNDRIVRFLCASSRPCNQDERTALQSLASRLGDTEWEGVVASAQYEVRLALLLAYDGSSEVALWFARQSVKESIFNFTSDPDMSIALMKKFWSDDVLSAFLEGLTTHVENYDNESKILPVFRWVSTMIDGRMREEILVPMREQATSKFGQDYFEELLTITKGVHQAKRIVT